jgi:hypothetical protein
VVRHDSVTSENATLQQQLLDRLQQVQQQKERCMAMLLGLHYPQQAHPQQQQQLAALLTPAAASRCPASMAAAAAVPAAINACDSPQFSSQSQLSRHLLFRQGSLEVSQVGTHSPGAAAARAVAAAAPASPQHHQGWHRQEHLVQWAPC